MVVPTNYNCNVMEKVYMKALLDHHARHNSGLTFDMCCLAYRILRGVAKRRNRKEAWKNVEKHIYRKKGDIITVIGMCKCNAK